MTETQLEESWNEEFLHIKMLCFASEQNKTETSLFESFIDHNLRTTILEQSYQGFKTRH